mmetsp:Transcript_37600/g.42961  ORF Transcript_37600/g.42961 Transcript_37600/m.42961 type:complete len:180 (+) Transcript_37600:69-608(+)
MNYLQRILLALILFVKDGFVHAFTNPATKPSAKFLGSNKSFLLSFQHNPSIIIGQSDGIVIDDVTSSQSFLDSINLSDDTTLILGFSAIAGIAFVGILKFVTNRINSTLDENVVIFESTMKEFFAQEWKEIEEELEEKTSTEEERAARLFVIMVNLEANKPELMDQVKVKMDRESVVPF